MNKSRKNQSFNVFPKVRTLSREKKERYFANIEFENATSPQLTMPLGLYNSSSLELIMFCNVWQIYMKYFETSLDRKKSLRSNLRLTLLHSERQILYGVLTVLSAIGLMTGND